MQQSANSRSAKRPQPTGPGAQIANPATLGRRALALAAWLALAMLTGCAMCQNPFDYCGPVVGPCGPNCDFGARCGSAFRPIGHTPPTTELGPTTASSTEPSEPEASEAPYMETPGTDDLDSGEPFEMPGLGT